MAQSHGAKKRKRRERDRPKAGPDAAYNPNKRVLLSYASDDGEDEPLELEHERPTATQDTLAVDPVDLNYQIEAYPDDDEQSLDRNEEPPAELVQVTEEEPKRVDVQNVDQQQKQDSSLWSRGVTRDTDTGQWPALGSLPHQQDDGLEQDEQDSETEEAMAYLRGVRSERQNMPAFFAAPAMTEHDELYSSGIGDSRGYLSEGTYVGRPDIGAVMPDSAKTWITPQEAYTQALKQRFLQQRQQMHVEPSAASLAALTEKHVTQFYGGESECTEWRKIFQETVPLPEQIRAIDPETVYSLLDLVQRFYLLRCTEIADNIGVWIWSLLARLDDVGTMTNDEVYMVREFAKRAVLVQLSFHDPAAAKQLEGMSTDGEVSSLERDTSKTDDTTHEGDPKDETMRNNTLITLDIIIAIVGDIFGQRDLLDFRREWALEE